MSSPDLAFRRIDIRRMPGFADGGFTVDDLCDGVNIIYGPNASGKTTLGRAIKRLLRPEGGDAREHSLRALLQVQGRSWAIDYDVGLLRCQCEGAEAELPPLAPAEVKDHYVLALHDLIGSSDGRDLAAEIVRQSAGGYDIAEARRMLGFQDRPSGKGKATRQLEEAVVARKEALRQQGALVEEEGKLVALRRQRDDARAAEARRAELQKALAYRKAAEQSRSAKAQLDKFPAGLAEVTGEEPARLEELDASIRKTEDERKAVQSRCEVAADRLTESRLPEEGVAAERIASLRRKCQRLAARTAEVPKCRQECEKAAARGDEVRRNLGGEIGGQEVARVDGALVARLAEFARRAEKLRAETEAARALDQWLAPVSDTPEGPSENFSLGARLLSRWVAASEPPGGALLGPAVWRGAAALVAVVALLLALLVHGSWWLLVGAVAVAAAARELISRGVTEPGRDVRREFESLGLEEANRPGEWTAADVLACAQRLQHRAAVAELAKERAARWANLDDRRRALDDQQKRVRDEKREMVEQWGLDLDCVEKDETWLSTLAAGLQRVQEADEAVAEAEAALGAAQRECRELLSAVNEELEPFGFEKTDDAELAIEQVERLAARQRDHESARREVAEHARALEGIGATLEEAARQRKAVFQRVGLAPDDEATLRDWAAQADEYQSAAEAARFAERELATARSAVDQRPELMGMDRGAAEEELHRCEDRIGRLEELTRQIGQIEGRIQRAKEGSDLEAAIARCEDCVEAVTGQREEDYGAVVGHVLAEMLARHERDRQRPAVFKDARRLFVEITHGRYRLEIDAGGPPGFRAIDTHREVGLALEELSSGTRLQLLLAVRVAFVGRQERGLKLPLVLDETLGNSDERRAEQIIDASIEICRGGRQIFYLTAQHDEVAKWRAMLARHGEVPSRVIDLAEIRQFSESERVPPMDVPVQPLPEVPPPGELDWIAYGRLLDVPPLDRYGPTGGVHLWYLVDDPQSLHRLLRRGVNRWGQFETLASYAHDPSVGKEGPVYRRAEASARLIEAACRLWREGRGRPVDRQALVDCPAVSARYLEDVCQLAVDASGDGRQLIARLEAGGVKGFRSDKRNDLREYLVQRGCLDPREPLSQEAIRDQVRPHVFADLEAGLLSSERVEQVLATIVRD